MRSISPVVAIVVLMVMTVAAAGMAYLTIVSYQEEATAGSGRGFEDLSARASSAIEVESLADGRLYIRSRGRACEALMIQVGSQAPEALGDCDTESTLTVFDLQSQCPPGISGMVEMKVTGKHGVGITQRIDCTDLGEGGAGGETCSNTDSLYKPTSRVYGSAGSMNELYFLGHNYTAQPGSTVKKIDMYMPYGDVGASNRGAGTVKFYITDDSIYSTDPGTLTPDASVVVPTSDQNKWVSVDLDVPVSGEFMVVVNFENSTMDSMPFGNNETTNPDDYSLLFCAQGAPGMDCVNGMVKYDELAPSSLVINMFVHTSTSETYTLCDNGYFCDSGSCVVNIVPPLCGNGDVDPDENCANCPADVSCGVLTCCDEMCVDTQTNGTYCGGCGINCTVTQYCSIGTCTECGTCDGLCPGGADCFGVDPDCDASGLPTLGCCGNDHLDSGENCTGCPADCDTYNLLTFADGSSQSQMNVSLHNNSLSSRECTCTCVV